MSNLENRQILNAVSLEAVHVLVRHLAVIAQVVRAVLNQINSSIYQKISFTKRTNFIIFYQRHVTSLQELFLALSTFLKYVSKSHALLFFD